MWKWIVWLMVLLAPPAQAQYYGVTVSTPTGKATMTLVGQELLYPSVGGATSIILQGNGGRITANGITLKSSATVQGPLSAQSGAFTGAVNAGSVSATYGIAAATGAFSGAVNAAVVNVATNTGAGIINTYNGDVAIGGDLNIAYSPNTAVMAHMDGAEGATAIPDSVSPATFTIVNAAYLTQANKKFGSASLYMTHWNDGAHISSMPQISSQTFTIDFWVYTVGCPAWQAARAFLVLNPDWTTTGGGLDMYNAAITNALAVSHVNYNGNDFLMVSGPGCMGIASYIVWGPYNGGWHHVALVRATYAGGINLYVDGVSKLVNICTGANIDVSNGAYIGAKQTRATDTATTASAVYMDELRIDVGAARWTSNFSPPNAAYYQGADLGRLIIGSPAVPNARLHINNTGAGRAVQVDASNGDIALNAGNGVLIGNSQYAPAAALDIRPAGTFPYLLVVSTDTAGTSPAMSVSTAGRVAFSNTITEAYGIAAATGAFSGAVTAASFAGAGGALTSLNAANLASGTIPDARLSANVPLLSASQAFTGVNTFTKTITETYGISASTIAITGTGVFGGATFYGAKTHIQLQGLACAALPCMAIATDAPYEVFLATGTAAGQWQGQTGGGGP
ncbi:MAG: LamG-like jellyroll fold domain-containing protein [Elusimicrobiales bacterium]